MITADPSLTLHILFIRKYDTRLFNRPQRTRQRTAKNYEISYYLDGDGSLNINGEEFPIRPGYIRFMRPGDLACSTMHFRSITVNFILDGDASDGTPLLSALPNYFYAGPEVEGLFERAFALYQSETPEMPLLCGAAILQLLGTLYQITHRTRLPEQVRKCMQYLDEHYDKHVTLDELGDISGYSPLHLHRLFLSSTGHTPHEYLTGVRIRRAKELLSTCDTPLDEVATLCGFNSPSHFKSLFKQNTGEPPGAFRRKMQAYL